MRVERKLGWAVFVLVLAVATGHAAAADDAASTSADISPDTRVGAPHGVRAYADPETGELVVPDGAEVSTVTLTGSGAAETAPLEIVPAPTTAGGVMVDLRGHFRHQARAHLVDDKLSADCIPASSPP